MLTDPDFDIVIHCPENECGSSDLDVVWENPIKGNNNDWESKLVCNNCSREFEWRADSRLRRR